MMRRQPRDEKESIFDRRRERLSRTEQGQRSAGIGASRSGLDSGRTGAFGIALNASRVYLRKCFHMSKNSVQLCYEAVEAIGRHIYTCQLGDVSHIVVGDRHYGFPRSSVVYASFIVLRPTFVSSNSITALMSRPEPESSAIRPPPNSLCVTLSPGE